MRRRGPVFILLFVLALFGAACGGGITTGTDIDGFERAEPDRVEEEPVEPVAQAAQEQEPEQSSEPARWDSRIEPGVATDYLFYVHCGITWLEVDGTMWKADPEMDRNGAVPGAWRPTDPDAQDVLISIVITNEPARTLDASAGGVTVVYRPATEEAPGCD